MLRPRRAKRRPAGSSAGRAEQRRQVRAHELEGLVGAPIEAPEPPVPGRLT
jgi:hypothetical protein